MNRLPAAFASHLKCFLPVAAACLLNSGCSTANLNPPAPRADTGYVDFYTDAPLELSWRVKRADPKTGKMRTVFSEFKPVAGNILRLASPAGTQRFEIWFINLVTTGPQTVDVQVENSKVTPVRVTLVSTGGASVQDKSYEYRPTPMASRRITRTTTEEQRSYKIGAIAADPQEYLPKERAAYFAPPGK